MTPEEKQRVQRGVDPQALRRRVDLRHLARGVRRQGPHAPWRAWCSRRSSPGRRRRCGPTSSATRSSGRRSSVNGTEEQKKEFLPEDPQRRDALVPGLQRARLRLRPGVAQDDRRARRRRVGDQRPEGVDDPGPVRRLLLRARPHRSRRRRSRPASPTCSCRWTSPAIEVRGITQPDGTAEFNEVFFGDARCPVENVVGGLNNGWKVANDTLGFERGMSATTGYRRFEEELRRMIDAAREQRPDRRPDRPPGPRPLLLEDPDPPHQRAAQPDRRR